MDATTPKLSELFKAYLLGERVTEFSAALSAAGYTLEAEVVSGAACDGSTWEGRRLWTGRRVPDSAQSGDIWLDTCQLTPMVLVPRDEEPYAWIDLRPVHRWQYAGFLGMAHFARREVQLEPPLTVLDAGRLLRGAETDSIADLTPDEARLCANWFGKALCGQFAWQTARAFLSDAAMAALWASPPREWAGEWADGVQLAVSPATIDLDPDLELESDAQHMVFGEWSHSPNTTFRTCVYLQLGLLEQPGEDGAWYFPHRLASRAPR